MGEILISYIKRHRAVLVAAAITAAIFVLISYLYSIPGEPVIYASLLALVVLILIGGARFFAYFKKQKELERIKSMILTAQCDFPNPSDASEKKYQQMIDILCEDRRKLVSENDKAYTDMVDYYTMWAHQIKTPIAAMRLMLEAEADAAQKALNAKETKKEHRLADQLFSIENYVEMVLHYLRSENMAGDMVLAKYSLDQIVKQVVMKYSRSFIYKRISLDMKTLEKKVLTDEKWLGFVLEQIISNALKYTQKGRISIYMEGEYTLVVEDTGIGIQKEDLPRVCEKGFTGFNGREDKKSTGIGLYLCKKILDRLCHQIKILSEQGQGTKVKIIFDKKKQITDMA